MEDEKQLSERQKTILRAVVDAHIRYGEPVGSKYIVQSQNLTCSSATIRNEMAELEEMGLLEQPHTSAGRVPTEAGYRYYVDTLLRTYHATASEVEQMSRSLRRKLGELDQVLAEASRLASVLTNYPGIAVKARPGQVTVNRFEGIYVEPTRFLLVMLFSSGTVRTKAVRCEKEIAQSDLETVLSTLNTWLVGRAAESINLPLMVELENAMGTLSWLVSPLCKIVYDAMAEQRESDLRVEGVNRLLQYPEYENIDELRNMISLFEDKQDLLTVIAGEGEGECGDADGVRVVIGSESAVKVMNNSALIYRPVKRNGEVIGAIGVVGPRRMDYAKVISTIDQLAERLDTLLGGTQPPALPAQPAAKDNSERNDS